jgi:hypothetical protein
MTTTTARFRYIGTTDECTTCEQCGKLELRNTVIIMPLAADGSDDGEPHYYGSTCAARALGVSGGGRTVRQAAEYARLATLMAAHDAVRMLRHYGLPLEGVPTREQRVGAMQAYVRAHPGIAERVAETGVGVRSRVFDMLARKRAAIWEAVMVAGAEWWTDPQPLEYYGRSVLSDPTR